jgi:hypothetical protein
MKNVMAGGIAAVLALASAGSLLAHHSLAQYDTTAAVRVKGILVRFEQVNPHSVLFLDEERPDGKIQRWAVEGPGVLQLKRLGIELGMFKAGDVIEACGYVTKAGVDRTVDTGSKTLKSLSGRLMDGEQIVMSDGQKRKWSDYGFHKCLEPDYSDFHSK